MNEEQRMKIAEGRIMNDGIKNGENREKRK